MHAADVYQRDRALGPPRGVRAPGGAVGAGRRLAGPLLTLKEVAARLRVSSRTLQGWVAAGRLPVYRLSRRAIRLSEHDVEEFLRRVGPG